MNMLAWFLALLRPLHYLPLPNDRLLVYLAIKTMGLLCVFFILCVFNRCVCVCVCVCVPGNTCVFYVTVASRCPSCPLPPAGVLSVLHSLLCYLHCCYWVGRARNANAWAATGHVHCQCKETLDCSSSSKCVPSHLNFISLSNIHHLRWPFSPHGQW